MINLRILDKYRVQQQQGDVFLVALTQTFPDLILLLLPKSMQHFFTQPQKSSNLTRQQSTIVQLQCSGHRCLVSPIPDILLLCPSDTEKMRLDHSDCRLLQKYLHSEFRYIYAQESFNTALSQCACILSFNKVIFTYLEI